MVDIAAAAAASIEPLAAWIVLSGLDDIFVAGAGVRGLSRAPKTGGAPTAGERPIAVFVPCWREDGVIARMLEHNLSAIAYTNYHFFAGAYPNDPATQRAVLQVGERYPNVHLALGPHDGPTCKADCLNWIYQRMLVYEQESGIGFHLVLTHDAEDLIHPSELAMVNQLSDEYGMIQTPVLALPTPLVRWTHGIYCDDFAQFHTLDMAARGRLGGFIPSCGVGTAFRRDALEQLAASESNRIFQPGCLTEDYENGFLLHRMGVRQHFLGIRFEDGRPVATRELFPQAFRAALRQRTRWVTGIALQTWQRHGWGRGREIYWFWRDRKGLIGNPLSLAANAIFFYGAATWLWSRLAGTAWPLAGTISPALAVATGALAALQIVIRAVCSARIYGWKFAAGVPLRSLLGNVLNSLATVNAIARFVTALIERRPLVWLKTEHSYPSLAALAGHRRRLGEILVGSKYCTQSQLDQALATKPSERRLGEHMVALGMIEEGELYEALSLQSSLPAEAVEPAGLSTAIVRALPAHVVRDRRVIPVRVEQGDLILATPELPDDALTEQLAHFTRLRPRFVLVTPGNFARLAAASPVTQRTTEPCSRP